MDPAQGAQICFSPPPPALQTTDWRGEQGPRAGVSEDVSGRTAQSSAASVAPTQEHHLTPGPRQGLSSLLEWNQPPGHSRGALQAKDVSALINELAV